ncbi:response regulator transcription factor [Treponema primitia]|uniref:response regulator transcription factor n=1 Tax=Treponema primitia TaxID=88058 RepID=UPI00025555E6|nr:response regulator transcription factor [Treponema primitia]
MNAVLVVDDEPKILDIVKSYLEKSGYRALTAKNGKEALAALQRNTVDLMLLDLMLPDLSGEELCRRVRSESDMPIIMMTAKVDEESIINGLRIGADDYVTKPFSPRQLMARVAAALRRSGGGPVEGRVLTCDVLSADTENRRVSKNGAALTLTPNEYKILTLLMSRPHKIFTRDEIIDNIKNEEYDGFDRTIDSHIKNLRQKIEDDARNPRYILTVYGMGYRFGGEASP